MVTQIRSYTHIYHHIYTIIYTRDRKHILHTSIHGISLFTTVEVHIWYCVYGKQILVIKTEQKIYMEEWQHVIFHQKCLSRGESVLVHCLAGAHRFLWKNIWNICKNIFEKIAHFCNSSSRLLQQTICKNIWNICTFL